MSYVINLQDKEASIWDSELQKHVHVIKNVMSLRIRNGNSVILVFDGMVTNVKRYEVKNCDDFVNKALGNLMQEIHTHL